MTRQSYAPEIRIVRLMCTGRVDLAFVIRAYQSGADGVIVGGCWPGECHYVTEGNYDALGNVHLCRKLMGLIGVRPERLRLEWIAASEGTRFAEVMSDFVESLRALGPLGQPEGIDGAKIPALIREQYGVAVAGGQAHLKGKIVRLSHMGYVSSYDMLSGLVALESTLRDLGYTAEPGASVKAALAVMAG